jgi:hypothetical protein
MRVLTPVWRSSGKAVAIPMLKAFAALDETKQNGLKDDLHALVVAYEQSQRRYMVVPSEYLELVITKR